MIVYLDASALVKLYVEEIGSHETGSLIASADTVGTSLISRAELSAALAKAVRLRVLTRENGLKAWRAAQAAWVDLVRIPVTESLVSSAGSHAWQLGLRGYDAMHLAAALAWQEGLGHAVTVATFDAQLWNAGRDSGLSIWPTRL
ncbi:MAG: type II toxin-antitoxin system VapC family toxin [Planctomycetota bacterium]